MMDPYLQSRESSAQFLAFRRLVYSFSEQLSKEERHAIVYIRLYSSREKYRDATTLEVLSKLETDCIFTPTKPEGLIEIAKDIKRQDLVNEVKDFIKRRKTLKDEKKMSKGATQAGANATKSDEDLHLRSILEVTLSQATVLMQQVDLLQRAMVAGQVQRRRVEEVVQEASQTAERLAETLHKAQTELLDPTYPQQTDSSSDSSPAVSPQNELPYCYVAMGTFPGATATPLQAQDLPDVTRPPVPMPRRPAHTTTQLPMQETCLSARTLTGYLANTHISSEQLHTQASSPSNMFPRPRRWTKPREDKSQSAPCTPSLQKRYSAHQPVTKKPAVPPRRTSFQSSPLGSRVVAAVQARTSYHTQPADVEDYVTLTPEPAGDYTGSTGDSGIGDIDQWRTRKGSETHYYKSLHRNELEDSYEELRRR